MGLIQRSRGYAFETKMVSEFNDGFVWYARRLGGTSTGLPDLIITNNAESVLFSVECKSTYGDYAYVPQIQLLRCNEMLNMFSTYRNKYIILAFKFAQKKPKQQWYYFFKILDFHNVKTITCRKNGQLSYTKLEKEKASVFDYIVYSTFANLKSNSYLQLDQSIS